MWIAITSRCLSEERVLRLGMRQAEHAVVARHLNVYRLSLWYIPVFVQVLTLRLALIRMRKDAARWSFVDCLGSEPRSRQNGVSLRLTNPMPTSNSSLYSVERNSASHSHAPSLSRNESACFLALRAAMSSLRFSISLLLASF